MRSAPRRLGFVLSFMCLGLTGGTVQAQQNTGWQTAYRSGHGPAPGSAKPIYGHRGDAVRQIRRTGRPPRQRRDVGEPRPPHRASSKPYVVDVEGNRCTGLGRLFPLARAGGGSAAIVAQSSPDAALRRLGLTMVEAPPQDGDRRGDSEMPAGYTFLAQFVDHDITFDTTSMLNMPIRDGELKNARTPDLDLDSVYGGGPEETPYLYQLPYLRVGRVVHDDGRALRYDLLRAPGIDGPGPTGGAPRALIGDPRNDENSILAQLHAGFIAFHNRMVDLLVERRHGQARQRYCPAQQHCDTRHLAAALPRATRQQIFEAARDHVVHYYHRVIVEDFLPRLIGAGRLRDLRARGRDFYLPSRQARSQHGLFIPVEFAVAAFRYGHSQVRETYWLRQGVRRALFGRQGAGGVRAGAPAFQPLSADLVVDWRYFFDIGPRPHDGFNLARKIDTAITQSLHDLGAINVVARRDLVSLPARNLSRGRTLRLPSGQAVAERILRALQARGSLGFWPAHTWRGRVPGAATWDAFLLTPDQHTRRLLGTAETPLWYYVLQEAAQFGTGARSGSLHLSRQGRHAPERYATLTATRGWGVPVHDARGGATSGASPVLGHTLGPVGGTIVGEVLLGLVDHYRSKTGK
ncbi:MAG: peroxidase family protein, partial [Methyloligellaceae bacterium]